MMQRTTLMPWLAAVVAALGLACSSRQQPRLVILYATCTVNKNFLSPYNPDVSFTPNLARLAQRSVVFERHQTEAGQSGIAFASIFSGQQAIRHGTYAHPKPLSSGVEVVTEVFADNGYETYSWLAHPMASAALNYGQGVPRGHIHNQRLNASTPEVGALLYNLVEKPDTKAFFITNFSVTHSPYSDLWLRALCDAHADQCAALEDLPTFEQFSNLYRENHLPLGYDFERTVKRLELSPEDIEQLVAVVELLYKAGIYHLDQLVGDLLKTLEIFELLDETLIVFTADHGEVLYREDALLKWAHGYQMAPEVLNVPMILHLPGGGPRGTRFPSVTRSVDVLPTLAGLANLNFRYEGPGVDLSAAVRGEEPAPELLAFSHSSVLPHYVERTMTHLRLFRSLFPRRDPELMWVAAREHDTVYKLRRLNGAGFTPAVFDLARDPTEASNLFDPENPLHRKRVEQLANYRQSLVKGYEEWEGPADGLSESRQEELLRSLGYIE